MAIGFAAFGLCIGFCACRADYTSKSPTVFLVFLLMNVLALLIPVFMGAANAKSATAVVKKWIVQIKIL